MDRIEPGMLAWSRSGHDKDRLYLVCGVEGDFVYLCDGKHRSFADPKKKNRKHIQIIHEIPRTLAGGEILREEEVRGILKQFENRCSDGPAGEGQASEGKGGMGCRKQM